MKPTLFAHAQPTFLDFREDLLMSLVLSGARKPSNSASFTVEIRGPWFMTLRGVNGLLAEHGYEKMVSARRAQGAASNWSGDDAAPTEFEIPVIDGTSLIDLDGPEPLLLIGRDEQIGAFCDKVRRLRVRCKDGKVTATSFPAQLEITFNRTLRLPEDGKIHNQPMRLDRIGVNNIASIAKKLEASQNGSLMDMARKGGVFFPLYQREAMFLSFKARHDAFAVRVFTGGVNAVSGLAWTVDMPRQMRTNAQDYLAVPPQRFLDGVCVAKDVVRQFIAMPLGSGYSIEKQVTGKEDVGGMQIQIAPANGWMLKIPGQDFFISEGRLTPRLLAVELLSLHKVRGWANTQDEMEDKKRFFDETMPVYIRHLYQSQVVRPPGTYGDASHLTAFYAGLTVSMVAMYMLNITLSYRDKGTQRMTTVEWAPWWTLDRCFAERRSAGFQVDGNFIEGMELYDQGRPLRRGGETLQQQGMLDQAVVIVQPREVGYPHPYYQYVSESGSGQQSAMAPGLDVQQQQTSGYGHHGYPAASVPHQHGYSYQFQYRPPQELQSYQAPGPQSAPGSTQPQSQQTPQTPSYYAPSSPSWGSPPPSMVSPQQSFGSSDMYTPPRPPKISSSAPPPSAPPSYGPPPPMPFQPPPQPQSPSFPTTAPPSYGSPPMPFQQPPPQTQAWASPPPPSSPSPATTTAAASPVVSEQGYYYSSPSTASPSVPASMVSSMPSMTSGMPASTGPSSSSYGSPPPRQSYPGPSDYGSTPPRQSYPGQTSAAVPPAQQPKPQEYVPSLPSLCSETCQTPSCFSDSRIDMSPRHQPNRLGNGPRRRLAPPTSHPARPLWPGGVEQRPGDAAERADPQLGRVRGADWHAGAGVNRHTADVPRAGAALLCLVRRGGCH